MRTYSRSDWNQAQADWRDFSDEWREVRHQAAMRGMLYPPAGTQWDSWEDDEPSQRAMLIRAIRETPKLLSVAISRSRTWHEVIAYVLARRDDWRQDSAHAELAANRHREDPTHIESARSIADILRRIEDSAA